MHLGVVDSIDGKWAEGPPLAHGQSPGVPDHRTPTLLLRLGTRKRGHYSRVFVGPFVPIVIGIFDLRRAQPLLYQQTYRPYLQGP